MSNQNTGRGYSSYSGYSGSRGRGRSPRPSTRPSHHYRNDGVGKPFADDSFGRKDGMSQGRGKYSCHTFPGRGSRHFNDRHTSNLVYRPKGPILDVISNSVEAEGSQMEQSECSSSPDAVCDDKINSVSVCSDSKNLHQDVSRTQIGETPQMDTEDIAKVNLDLRLSVDVEGECFQGLSLLTKTDTEDQASEEKDDNNMTGFEDSGHSVLRATVELDVSGIQIGETPKKRAKDISAVNLNYSSSGNVKVECKESPPPTFDICLPKTGIPVLKPSLLVKNRQKRNEGKLSMEGPNGSVLRTGMVLLKNYLSISEQVKIVKKCRDLGLGHGGFYQPGYTDGGRLHLKMMCLGKNWDPNTSEYGDIRSQDDAKPPSIPGDFCQLVEKAIKDSHATIGRNAETELPWMSPNICIVNFYLETGKLGLHQDRDESRESLDKGLPVVSFSIGDSAEFLYGDQRDVDKAEKVILDSGDVLIFGGKSRHIFHGVSKIILNTAPKVLQEQTNCRPGRLNLTFRQY